jgi:Na+/H+ antiporter NhaD/arsenite permease-like protein
MVHRALPILVILGPLVFLIICLCFTLFFYKKKKIPQTYPEKEQISKTYHNHIMMVMCFIIIFSIFAIGALYARDFVAYNPHLMT